MSEKQNKKSDNNLPSDYSIFMQLLGMLKEIDLYLYMQFSGWCDRRLENYVQCIHI